MKGLLTRKAVLLCSVVALCAAGLGCSGSGDDASEDMMQQMDMDMDMVETEMAPAEDALTEVEQAVNDLRVTLATADKMRDAAAYGTEELNRVGDITVTRKHRDWEYSEGVTGWHAQFQAHNSGSKYTTFAQSYRDGSNGWLLVWYDEDGNQTLSYGAGLAHRPLQTDPELWTWRAGDSSLADVEGVTSSNSQIDDHGLGSTWQGFEISRMYEGSGTLTMRAFTDAASPGGPTNPYTVYPGSDAAYPDIELEVHAASDIPAGWEGHWLYAGGNGLRGTMNGEPGTFSCAEGDRYYCGLEVGRHHLAPGYTADAAGDPVIFTPDDGSAVLTLPHPAPVEVPSVNYLSFGTWLFLPEDIYDFDLYDFGMFASGDDPFTVENLQGLTGTANYSGEASGMFADEVEATLSPFSARVALAADFGTADNFGSILGSVYGFEIESGEESPLQSLDLNGAPWRDERNNIFDSWQGGGPLPGGLVQGWTGADVGTARWRGSWGGKFFGNGVATTDLPASYVGLPSAFAGTFGATDGDHTFAGSFGARRQHLTEE